MLVTQAFSFSALQISIILLETYFKYPHYFKAKIKNIFIILKAKIKNNRLILKAS